MRVSPNGLCATWIYKTTFSFLPLQNTLKILQQQSCPAIEKGFIKCVLCVCVPSPMSQVWGPEWQPRTPQCTRCVPAAFHPSRAECLPCPFQQALASVWAELIWRHIHNLWAARTTHNLVLTLDTRGYTAAWAWPLQDSISCQNYRINYVKPRASGDLVPMVPLRASGSHLCLFVGWGKAWEGKALPLNKIRSKQP